MAQLTQLAGKLRSRSFHFIIIIVDIVILVIVVIIIILIIIRIIITCLVRALRSKAGGISPPVD
jgi:hypothetical protein